MKFDTFILNLLSPILCQFLSYFNSEFIMILPSFKSHFIENIVSRYAQTYYALWVLKSEGICGNALGDVSDQSNDVCFPA